MIRFDWLLVFGCRVCEAVSDATNTLPCVVKSIIETGFQKSPQHGVYIKLFGKLVYIYQDHPIGEWKPTSRGLDSLAKVIS